MVGFMDLRERLFRKNPGDNRLGFFLFVDLADTLRDFVDRP